MDIYQQYIFKSRYARNNESWPSAINRYLEFLQYDSEYAPLIKQLLLDGEIVGSMRLLKTAGMAAQRDNAATFNCSRILVQTPQDFCEIMYLLMCGCGVGFSIYKSIKLPTFPTTYIPDTYTFVIPDDRIGWCKAFEYLFKSLSYGRIPQFDYSLIRPKGTPLVTFGGYASGPEVLKDLFEYTIKLITTAHTITPIIAFDIMTKIADIVVCGGVRRSALLCDTDCEDVLIAKSGKWYETNPHRRFANISKTYWDMPSKKDFQDHWNILRENKSGEPGIFNKALAYKKTGILDLGFNPCGEVLIKPYQFCNLSEVICKYGDTLDFILTKLQMASILSMLQSKLYHFRYLRQSWFDNAYSDPILGVSLTGIYDCPAMLEITSKQLSYLKSHLDSFIDLSWAKLGLSQRPKRVTCIKPSGTVSQLLNCSAGIHPRPSQFYIRNVSQTKNTPMASALIDIPHFDNPYNPKNEVIYQFPCASPNNVTHIPPQKRIHDYLKFMESYIDHNISNTVFIPENSWDTIGDLVFNNLNSIIGMAFFPESPTVYQYYPEQPISEDEYTALSLKLPLSINWPFDIIPESVLECSGESCKLL